MRLKPTMNQQAFIASPVMFTLFGGARGGGKTYAVIIDWLIHSEAYGRHARGIVFRRELTELEDFIENAMDILLEAGHRWMEAKKQFISPSGAILRCRYLDNDKDAQKYQGHSYTRVYIEEIGNFPNEAPVKLIFGTLRSAHGVPCAMKATANPGGPGHSWVKEMFINPAAPRTPFSMDGGKTWAVFIPSLLTDNPYLMENDPTYKDRLKLAGSAELVKAWLEGDWDVTVGQFFTEYNRIQHVIPTSPLPKTWSVRYRAMDWGSARPFAVLWFAVANGDQIPGVAQYIPRGALVVYRELYGWNGKPNQGCRKTSSEVGSLIVQAEASDRDVINANDDLNKVDPSTFATNGGPSIAEEMARMGAWFHRADNRRVAGQGRSGGWDQVRNRLTGEDGHPRLFIMDCCTHLIRTLPTLPTDSVVLDDIDTDAEDHAADALRYGCMARPYEPPVPQAPKQQTDSTAILSTFTMDQAWQCQIFVESNAIQR